MTPPVDSIISAGGRAESLDALRRENAKLRKIVEVLSARVEHGLSEQRDAFSVFQTAIALEDTVRKRTAELKRLNERLTEELEQRRAVEEALRVAKRQAEETNISKTKFLAAASHDLRQPLSAARLFLAAIGEGRLDARTRKHVERARAALDAADNLLDALLDISRLDSGGLQPEISDFCIGDLLERITPEYQTLKRKEGLEVRVIGSSAVVRTDARLLEQILRNLLSNAIRYTPAGKVVAGCRRLRDGIRIEVWDTGIGIPESQFREIFKEFRQVHTNYKPQDRGIGLGLAIVDRIARMLGLEITVRSQVGKGSVFTVRIPYGDASRIERTTRARARPRAATMLAGSLIVVVDNDDRVLDGMEALLSTWNCEVVSAHSADRALEALIEGDRRPDLIIADYHLEKGAKGDAAIREIAAEFDAPVPAIIITSDQSPGLRRRLEANGQPVLYKPVKPAKLRSIMTHILFGDR